MTVSSFLMCDFRKFTSTLDALWPALSRALAGSDDVPSGLVRGEKLDELWRDEALFVNQRCGYDLVNYYAGILRSLVTPHYTAPGC